MEGTADISKTSIRAGETPRGIWVRAHYRPMEITGIAQGYYAAAFDCPGTYHWTTNHTGSPQTFPVLTLFPIPRTPYPFPRFPYPLPRIPSPVPLTPSPYIQAPDNTQNLNRYSYCLNNPLKYTDSSGEFLHLVIGAAIGGVMNWVMNGAEFSWEGLGYFGIGAAAGALGAGVGVGIQTASAGGSFWAGFVGSSQGISTILSVGYTSSFANGALAGAGGGFAGCFGTGFGNGLMQGQSVGQAAWSGIKAGFWGGVSGAALGGITGGIDAELDNRNFWTGGENAKVYRSPVGDNFGRKNGECVLRCFEEFCDSYGMDQYDYDYWFKQNGSKLGVKPGELKGIVEGTGVFSSDRIMPEANSIAKAFSNEQRVLMGFNKDNGGAHAVMVNKVKIWPSGRYRIWFAETSPVRIAPYSTSNIFNLEGAAFWTFFPR